MEMQRKKNFRKRSAEEEAEGEGGPHVESDDEQERRMTLEEVKFLQKQRERKSGSLQFLIPICSNELYKIPDHLKVKRRNSEESSTQWTTGIAEIQLPIEYKLRNIEETEAAKKILQERRLMGIMLKNLEENIPSCTKTEAYRMMAAGSKQNETGADAAGQRQAATDQFMLERFRKRERHRVMRR
ncbi:hypothetical protein SLA2020_404560 [Shorea laevis]